MLTMSDFDLGPWGIAVSDQLQAAVAADNWPEVGRIAIDGYLHALEIDNNGGPASFEQIVAALSGMPQWASILWGAEAIKRLYEQRIAK